MKSLESKIRDLMIAIAMEQDKLTLAMDNLHSDSHSYWRYIKRRNRLKQLAEKCIINIDREIEFFQK